MYQLKLLSWSSSFQWMVWFRWHFPVYKLHLSCDCLSIPSVHLLKQLFEVDMSQCLVHFRAVFLYIYLYNTSVLQQTTLSPLCNDLVLVKCNSWYSMAITMSHWSWGLKLLVVTMYTCFSPWPIIQSWLLCVCFQSHCSNNHLIASKVSVCIFFIFWLSWHINVLW